MNAQEALLFKGFSTTTSGWKSLLCASFNFSFKCFFLNSKSALDDQPITGLTTVKFSTSVPMVTYLACFTVCDFKERHGQTARGVPMRAIVRPNQYDSTEYPLEIGIKVTDFYEKYFDIEYVLPKLGIYLFLY